MRNFLVVSFDPDQQQWFYDFEIAADAETAVAKVLASREYCIAGTAFDSHALHKFADDLDYSDPNWLSGSDE